MNRFKQFCLLLCCSLVCLNGFSPVVSYANNGIFYFDNMTLEYRDQNWYRKNILNPVGYNEETDFYIYNSVSYNGLYGLLIGNNDSAFFSNIEYLPDVFAYYMIITAYSDVPVSEFSFAPNAVYLWISNCDNAFDPTLQNLKYYHHDKSEYQTGFTLVGKIPELSSTSISTINIVDENLGDMPESELYLKLNVIAVDKNIESEFMSALYEELNEINDSINNQGTDIQEAINELQQTIEDQYSVSDEENFGVEDIVDQVNEKAGVLSFGTDTLVNFLDLFDSANATNTKLTFPGFSMKIQGVDYQVWPDYHYDLSELENQFGVLIEVVRWGCVMCVWLAVLNYLVKAYDTIFGR